MSEFEFLACFVAVLLAAFFWIPWYADLIRVAHLQQNRQQRTVLGAMPVLCLGGIAMTLMLGAARKVRVDALWIGYYTVLGAAWIAMTMKLTELLGLDVREDVLERGNRGAFFVTLAAMTSFAICYAGGNVGEGPGAVAVIASVGVVTGIQLLAWFALELFGGHSVSERITIERDGAAAMRLCGMLLCNGIILGVAATGDWGSGWFVSILRAALPVLPVTAIAIAVERRKRRGLQ